MWFEQQNLSNRRIFISIFLFILFIISCKKENTILTQEKPPVKDSLIILPPEINYFIPKYGIKGDYVKIFGKNIDYKNLRVKFGNLTGLIDRADSNTIIVKVPEYSQTKYCKISVISGTNEILAKDSFLLYGPIVKSFTPEGGKGLQKLILIGENFSEIPWRNKVTIGDHIAEVTKASKQQIEAIISLNSLKASSYAVSITVDNISYTSTKKFNVQSPWTQLASLPVSGIAGGVTFEINNKIYYCCGKTQWLTDDSFVPYVFEYDIATGQWSRKNDFPGVWRSSAVCFTINGEAYMGLGIRDEIHKVEIPSSASDFWKYNPQNDKWTKLNDFPGLPRRVGAAFSYNNKGYVMMGSGYGFFTDSWRYTPETDQWEPLSDFPGEGRNDLHIARQDHIVYMYYSTKQSFDSNEIWKYDLNEDSWKYMDKFENHAIVSFCDNNKSYFIDRNSTFFQFIPDQNISIRKPDFQGMERAGFAETGVQIIVGNKIYFGAGSVGEFGGCINDFWSYDIE